MLRKVAFVTYSALPYLTEDDRLALDPLRAEGAETQAVLWDSPDVRWEEFDCVVMRSCWEYHLRVEEFSAWIDRMERAGVRLWNPPQVIRLNMDKRYLEGLAQKGVTVAPSVWLEKGESLSLAAMLRENGWEEAVVKPTISMTAFKTWITSPAQASTDEEAVREILKSSGVMIQRFVPEVRTKGEWSFIFFWKKYSHGVLKRAKAGDFRVQNDFGGYLEDAAPSRSLVEQAQRIVDLVEEPLLFARVDGIDVDGTLLLMELELIDPVLFLGADRHAPLRFASAIMSTALF
jgi:glutathione synthase/RimK-type ligase-like ATP-grasp enzyme